MFKTCTLHPSLCRVTSWALGATRDMSTAAFRSNLLSAGDRAWEWQDAWTATSVTFIPVF